MTQIQREDPKAGMRKEPGLAADPVIAHPPDADAAGLWRIADIAADFGALDVAAAARMAAERTSEGRFYVACMGQFKRGKSTLLNALVDMPVLPTGISPVTTIPTIIRYGKSPAARVRLQDGRWTEIPINEVERYVSGENNPENLRKVAALEIFVPTPRLATGMCLVDTPGLGSVFTANTAATREFIPQTDAAIVVIGADPPISHDELALVEEVARETRNLIFVLNKADRSSPAERAVAMAFAKRVLASRLGELSPAIFETSALEQSEHRGSGRDWPRLVQALDHLAELSGCVLIREATERALRRAVGQLRAVLDEERGALERPLAESQRRIAALRRAVEEAEQALGDLGVLLAAVQQRLSAELAERRKSFLATESLSAQRELDERIAAASLGRNGVRHRRHLMRLAQEIAFARIAPWLEHEAQYAAEAYRDATTRFVELSNAFVRRFEETHLAESSRLAQSTELETTIRSKVQFRFHAIERVASPASPLLFVADLAAGIAGLRGGIARDAHEFLAQLLDTNSARAHSEVEDRLRESRQTLEKEVRAVLRDAIQVAELALARASAANDAGASAMAEALARIERAERQVYGVDPNRLP